MTKLSSSNNSIAKCWRSFFGKVIVSVSAKSRKFYRTDISRKEQTIGGFIILILIGIGITISIKGLSFDPSKYTGDDAALEFTREAVVGIAATLKNEVDLRASEQTGFGGAPAAAAASGELSSFLNDLSAMGPTEHYIPDTLYEKINGRAPAYLEYNFSELTTRSFIIESAAGEFLDIYLFRMDSPLNAFGIFSAERDDSGAPLEFVDDGYESEMGYFLRRGDIYVQTLASSTKPEVMSLALAYTKALVQSLPADDSGMEGRSFLPAEAQIPGSLTYINDNAYGQAALSSVFEARYQAGDQELTYFVKSCADGSEAKEIFGSVTEFYNNYGSEQVTSTSGSATLFSANMFGQWANIYQKDNIIAGVINASDLQAAADFVNAQISAADSEDILDEY